MKSSLVSIKTQILRVASTPIVQDIIAQAAAVIRRGGLVAFPTETVYGLGANALDAEAVRRIFVAKNRPAWDPLIVHVSRVDMARQVMRETPALFETLTQRFWSGPLTLVVPKADCVPDEVTAGLPTVAVRMPSHPVALALIEAAGMPIAAPSANRFGRTSPTRAEHVLADLSGRIDLVLDAGATAVGVESTVLDLTQSPPVVLRPGGVTVEQLREVVGEVELASWRVGEQPLTTSSTHQPTNPPTALLSPGMLPTHYAPNARLLLFDGDAAEQAAAMRERTAQLLSEGKRVGALTLDDVAHALTDLPVTLFALGAREELEDIARNLFAGLRALDAAGVDVILCPLPPERGLGRAVRDRLRRAAGEMK